MSASESQQEREMLEKSKKERLSRFRSTVFCDFGSGRSSSQTFTMRASTSRLIEIVRRSSLPKDALKTVHPAPAPRPRNHTEPTLIDYLLERKAKRDAEYAASLKARDGARPGPVKDVKPWPVNLRIEPVVSRATFANVPPETRQVLKEVLKER